MKYIFRLISIILFITFNQFIFGQTFEIKIVDEEKEALSNVVYYSLDFKQQFVSNNDGLIEIKCPCNSAILISQYLGYVQDTIIVAQLNTYKLIKLKPLSHIIEQVLVLGRTNSRADEIIAQIETIDALTIKEKQLQTAADALSNQSVAFVQKSQMGGGSPIVRGFEANKLLLVIDGVRMNNAIYRSGHLQNAISVDPAIIDQMDVLYGPGSLIYGSDALGGVIHFKTIIPKFSQKNKLSGGYYTRYSSANEEKSAHLHLGFGSKKLSLLSSISFSDYGNLRAGANRPDKYPDFGLRPDYVDPKSDLVIQNKNPNVQIGTAYSQVDFLQKINYQVAKNFLLSANFQYSASSDIPRYDELILKDVGVFERSEWYYGPQKRLLASIKSDVLIKSQLADRIQLIAAFQSIGEDRHVRSFQSESLRNNLEGVSVYTLNVDINKTISAHQKILYGAEIHLNDVTSDAFGINIKTGQRDMSVFTRYPSGGSKMRQSGMYGQWTGIWSDWLFQLGGRFSENFLKVNFLESDPIQWPEYFYDGITQNTSAFTWNAGLKKTINKNLIIHINSGTAFRAPNIDDFAKTRVRSDNLMIPNPNLSPEKTWNIEGGLSYTFVHNTTNKKIAELNLVAYYTKINDAIVRSPFSLPNGDDTYILEGNLLAIQANENAQSGQISGISAKVLFHINPHLKLNTSINFQTGTSELNNESQPLAHIPPAFGHIEINYSKNKISAAISNHFNAKKGIEDYAPNSSDNIEYASPEGSLAWNTTDLQIAYEFSKAIKINCGLDNIFDLHYRPFSSGVSAPGRNFKIGVYGSF